MTRNTAAILAVAILSAVLYLLAFVFYLCKKQRVWQVLWCAGVAGNLFLVVNNWVLNGYVPFITMYQVLTFLALLFGPLYLYMRFARQQGFVAPYCMVAAAVCLTGVCFMGVGTEWQRVPALQSVWFIPHVLCYMISYSLCAVAFLMTVFRLIRPKGAERLEGGAHTLIQTAYPFMTAAMFFGAIWANSVWGAFWSFDAKENWSLVTWLLFTLYLHFVRTKKLKKFANLLVILGFAAILVTLLFVNRMGGQSYHTYSSG